MSYYQQLIAGQCSWDGRLLVNVSSSRRTIDKVLNGLLYRTGDELFENQIREVSEFLNNFERDMIAYHEHLLNESDMIDRYDHQTITDKFNLMGVITTDPRAEDVLYDPL